MQNFGITKNIFKEFLVEKISTKKEYDKTKFKQVIKALKENKILRKQFNVYTNIESLVESDETHIYEYITDNLSLFDGITKKQIQEANKYFNKLVVEFVGDFKVNPDGELVALPAQPKVGLYEAIDYLILNKHSDKSINNRSTKKQYIKEYVKGNKVIEKGTKEPVPLNMLSKVMVDKFNRKYDSIDESGKLIIKSLIESSSDEKFKTFHAMVKECVGIVDNLIEGANEDLKAKLSLTKVKLIEMGFEEDSFTDSITKLVSLKDKLTS
tara:strand:- start:286 stop:1089 length:804 start_codon:yes stop_codon:yes gene_type:complete